MDLRVWGCVCVCDLVSGPKVLVFLLALAQGLPLCIQGLDEMSVLQALQRELLGQNLKLPLVGGQLLTSQIEHRYMRYLTSVPLRMRWQKPQDAHIQSMFGWQLCHCQTYLCCVYTSSRMLPFSSRHLLCTSLSSSRRWAFLMASIAEKTRSTWECAENTESVLFPELGPTCLWVWGRIPTVFKTKQTLNSLFNGHFSFSHISSNRI